MKPAPVLVMGVGCNRGPKVLPVSGTVTYDGQPVSHAIITIVPNGSGGKPTQAGIVDGKFSIAKKFGVLPGTYNVTMEEAPNEENRISDVEPEEEGKPRSNVPTRQKSVLVSGHTI